jgi:uncharacterized metal-binding protein YceD (DUF177 family)
MTDTAAPSPVSFRVHVSRLPKKGMEVVIEADEAQREALARLHGLEAVERFTAPHGITAWKRGGVRVTGRIGADIVQQCVVTLDPVPARVDEEVAATFLPEGSRLARPTFSAEGEILLDAEGEDGPETFSGDTIDVGQLAEEFFALGIDPYPRKAGVAIAAPAEDDEETGGPLHDKLAELRKKL